MQFLDEGYNCALCQDGREETVEHIFFDRPSLVTKWFAMGINWHEDANIHEKLHFAKQAFLYGNCNDWGLVHLE